MKVLIRLVVIMVTIISFTGVIWSQDTINVVSRITDADIDNSLLMGVKTNNLGLKVSAAYYLGERQSSRAVIPLMDVLHTDESVEARIIAALSLYKIGEEKGIYAIKRAIEFDENEQVRRMCEIFYMMYLKEQGKKE